MATITADPNLLRMLKGIIEATEIRDETGCLLGTYTPNLPSQEDKYKKARELFDPNEIARRKKEEVGTGKPLAEVLKRLQGMEQP